MTISARNTELVRGDRDFAGHGLEVVAQVKLKIARSKKAIQAEVFFAARETAGDKSATRGKWTETVYQAPQNMTIESIESVARTKVKLTPRGQTSAKTTDLLGAALSPRAA